MKKQSLEPAPSAAPKTAPPSSPFRRTGDGALPPSLIEALKNSATHKDQIIQRRIGTATEPEKISTKSRQVGRTSCPKE
jgi:hypothetical protein